tara:strand:- start:497 stop:1804 length:1308 start_codon:yes stop_codon:yes gene_type:complete
MPNWKKVIVSGSDASLNSLYVTGAVTSSAISSSYIDLDPLPLGSEPAHKEGRIFYSEDNSTLSLYNSEADITLQVGQEFWKKVKNGSGVPILNGTPVRISGSLGDNPTIYPATAPDHTTGGGIVFENHIIGIATHDIGTNAVGFVTELGIINNVDTSLFAAGDILYLQTGSPSTPADYFRNDPPPFPYDIIQAGFVVRSHPTGGKIEANPKEPTHLSNISGFSGSASTTGELFIYDNSFKNAWSPGRTFSGSYTFEAAQLDIQGGVTASSYTGSFIGDGSGTTGIISASYAVTSSHALNTNPTAIAVSYFNVANSSLADNTSYLLGQMTGLATSPNAFAHIPLPAGTITDAYIEVYNAGTFATSENITINLISDGGVTSDTLSSTVTADTRHQTFIVTGLSIAIVAGGTWISIETPAFATNPTATQFRIMIQMTL